MRSKANKIWALFMGFLPFSGVWAQAEYLPLNNPVFSLHERSIHEVGSTSHTAIRPLLKKESITYFDSVKIDSPFLSGILNGHALSISKPKMMVGLNPILNVTPFYETGSWPSRTNSYISNGLGLTASFGNKLHIESRYLYSDADEYTNLWQRSEGTNLLGRNLLSGLERTEPVGDVLLYKHYFDGYVSYTPTSVFNFQLGMGRNFFGDGYRSMLLSDYAFNYPYFKITTEFWKIKYVNLYAMQFDIGNAGKSFNNFQKKYSTTHYLSINIGKRWNVGLFESVVWRGQDSLHNRGFDVNYMNPVIFFRPVEFSVGSPDNVLIGLNASYKLLHNHVLYGQVLIDEFLLDELRARNGWWANKYAFQLGIKNFIGKHFILQGEYNFARPFTYSHSTVLQNYAHFNQPLAHPLGANFKEMVVILKHNRKRRVHEAKFILASFGIDGVDGNVGQNLYLSNSTRTADYGHDTGQGVKRKRLFMSYSAGYVLNPKSGLMISLGIQYTELGERLGESNSNTTAVFLGIKTPLFNQYPEH